MVVVTRLVIFDHYSRRLLDLPILVANPLHYLIKLELLLLGVLLRIIGRPHGHLVKALDHCPHFLRRLSFNRLSTFLYTHFGKVGNGVLH